MGFIFKIFASALPIHLSVADNQPQLSWAMRASGKEAATANPLCFCPHVSCFMNMLNTFVCLFFVFFEVLDVKMYSTFQSANTNMSSYL